MDWPSGKVLWTKSNDRGHDVQYLSNGHVLYTNGAKKLVQELDEKRAVVWSYGPAEMEHPLSAQRLANGNTLIGDAQAGRVFEVSPDKKIVWKYESPALAKMRSRNSHRTDQGTTLIAIEAESKILEVDKEGKVAWQWQAPNGDKRKLYQARRLPNGNTMASLSDPGELVEVDPAGKIVRSIGGDHKDIKMGWTSGYALLPDGGVLINDYTGRRLIEVDAKGNVVNEMRTGARTIATVDIIHW